MNLSKGKRKNLNKTLETQTETHAGENYGLHTVTTLSHVTPPTQTQRRKQTQEHNERANSRKTWGAGGESCGLTHAVCIASLQLSSLARLMMFTPKHFRTVDSHNDLQTMQQLRVKLMKEGC